MNERGASNIRNESPKTRKDEVVTWMTVVFSDEGRKEKKNLTPNERGKKPGPLSLPSVFLQKREQTVKLKRRSVNTLSDIPLQPRTQSCKKIPIPHLNRKRRRRVKKKTGINKNKNSPSKSSPNTSDRSFALRGRSPVKLEKVKDGGGESSTHEIVDLQKSRIYFLPPMLAGFHAVGLSPGRKSGRY
ncbi:hypothetical protein TNCT_658641 [Trichonephila clavata]|uniref:Uncharacterized protein n=1 Tax=Trichonephila clavata TaxID=2740835 RepID=A0A8X6G8X6_TRICU|nr:hypothetical protein TNCT_658641 [Trichonephila clavata]